ncbi:MAG TPA: Lrp/AsnC family transcriptional regulator [Steroidobacteraceae bacterium]|nr:Lrp/AsnC family transcriptional regulator [Steroidobacteraceae bacterium]
MSSSVQLDRLDVRLVAELQRDGRRTVVELAEAVGLSGTPCARRLRRLEESGVIQGYTAVVDPGRLGLAVQAFVQVKLERHTDENIAQFRRALEALDEVVSCYATTGAYDFLLQVVATDLDALSNVVLKKLLKIPSVRDVYSSIVLDTMKRSAHVPLGHLSNREKPSSHQGP